MSKNPECKITEQDKMEVKRLIDEYFSHRLTEEQRAAKMDWIFNSSPAPTEVFIRYVGDHLTKVGVICRYSDGRGCTRRYMITEYGEEFDDD